jgi:hypothetical protein
MRTSTLLEPPSKLGEDVRKKSGRRHWYSPRCFIIYQKSLFMDKRMLASSSPNLQSGKPKKKLPITGVSNCTLRPRPFPSTSNVSRTWVTKSLVGRMTSARNWVRILDERI